MMLTLIWWLRFQSKNNFLFMVEIIFLFLIVFVHSVVVTVSITFAFRHNLFA
jgi:hypothetical protein